MLQKAFQLKKLMKLTNEEAEKTKKI